MVIACTMTLGCLPTIVDQEYVALHILIEAIHILEAISNITRIPVKKNECGAVFEATLFHKPCIECFRFVLLSHEVKVLIRKAIL